MTTDQTDAIRLIQSGLDRLGHSPGTVDGQWGVRTARALKSLLSANGRPASLAPVGSLPWITEAKTALGKNEARDGNWLMDWLKRDGRSLGDRDGVLRPLRIDRRAGHHIDARRSHQLRRHRLPAWDTHPLAAGRKRRRRCTDPD